VVVGAIAVLPADLRERFFGRSPAEGVAGAFGGSLMSSALRFVADAIAWTTIPVSLFLGAAIGLGDRLHGARLLAAVLPHRRRDRVISIMTVGLFASLVPPLVMFGVAWLSGRPTIGTEVPALLPMASVSAVGIGLGLGLMLTGRQANGLGGWTVRRWHCVVLGALVLGSSIDPSLTASRASSSRRPCSPFSSASAIGSEASPSSAVAWRVRSRWGSRVGSPLSFSPAVSAPPAAAVRRSRGRWPA
jgi:cytochrome bd-type quinol oxidase subunit 2